MAHLMRDWAILSAVITNTVLVVMGILASTRHRGPATARLSGPAVTVARPFRGVDPGARAKHQTLLAQEYTPLRVMFVCTSPDDPGIQDVRAACAADPRRASLVIALSGHHVPSDKARNMIEAWRRTNDPFIAFCDSDIELHPLAIAECMTKFDDRAVGAVFAHCIIDSAGALGRLSMLTLTSDAYAFLMGAARLGVVPFLQGGLMVLRREAVELSGGISITANAIGDDTRLGRKLRANDFELRLADFVIVHRSPEGSLSEGIRRYRRWLLCHRAEAPAGFWAELVLNPTVAPLLALPFFGSLANGLILLLGSVAVRIATTAFVDRALLRRHEIRLGVWCWAKPIADILHLAMCVSVVAYPWIVWRGLRYFVRPNGDIARTKAGKVETGQVDSRDPAFAEAADPSGRFFRASP